MPFRLILIIALLWPAAASAQPDWMKTLQGVVGGVTGQDTATVAGLSQSEIVAGLKEALRVGTDRVTGQLAAAGGFNADPAVHIPLPPALQSAQSTLRRFGLSALADEVELKLNRGAEAAMPKARELVWKAITDMTLQDAADIYQGPDDAATQYFRKVATPDLTATVAPVIETSLREVGALAAYDDLMGQYRTIPFVPDLKANLTDHATRLALDGLFHYLAREEAAIRTDPAARTTEILSRVFGAK